MILWRISNYADLAGTGGILYGGRWHTRGRPIVYLATSPSSALLESVVHLEIEKDRPPLDFQLLEVELPDGVQCERVDIRDLAENWREQPRLTARMGDAWLERGASLLLLVPSAVAPHTEHALFNPTHPAAAGVQIVSAGRHPFDPRLFQG